PPHPPSLPPRRSSDLDVPPGPYSSVTTALLTRVGDHLAVSKAGRTRPSRDDLTEERTLHGLHLALATARVARRHCRLRRYPRPADRKSTRLNSSHVKN